ncbi:MAG: hypothetical protein ACOYPR_08590 [Saprospiraceae bacterium]
MKYPLLLFAALVLTLHCHSSAGPTTIIPAFYFWQTESDYISRNFVEKLGVQKIFLRLFDVAWDGQKPIPAGPYRGDFSYSDIEMVPVVFITNETMQHLDSSGCVDLATRISRKSKAMLRRMESSLRTSNRWDLVFADSALSETQREDSLVRSGNAWLRNIRHFQIDCDWTASTRARYFYLLEQLQALNAEWTFSATIRLHQYKNPEKTGVPPVKSGMLMCYNVDDLKDPGTENSIFNYNETRKYLQNAPKYPMPLDVALPAFRWGVLFHLNQFQCIIPDNALGPATMERLEAIDKTHFRARMDFTLNDHFIREGDIVRLESADQKELLKTVQLLRSQSLAQPLTVSFFHLNSNLDEDAAIPQFQEILTAFN